MQLDHLFVLTSPGAPLAARLLELGLSEGSANTHPGQGTANRRFYFANGMLELLWVRDAAEARSGPGRELRFPERATRPDACPVGLILRPDAAPGEQPPFPGWAYQPDYFPPPRHFHVGENSSDLGEPLCVYVPWLDPGAGVGDVDSRHRLLETALTLPARQFSEVLLRVARTPGLRVTCGSEQLLTLTLAGAGNARSVDLRPELALVLELRP